jgi:short-subunit dehydrogenase
MKTVLITGAGTGIGKDTAIALCKRGHTVLATTETETQARALKAELEQLKIAIEVFKMDVTVPEDRLLVSGRTIDVLINNAAIGESGSLSEVPMERVRNSFEVNVFSPLVLTQLILRDMMKRDSGTVIFVSSIAGRIPMPFLNPYSMTKHAISAGIAALREEIASVTSNVNISLVEPGTYGTGFNQRMLATKFEWMDKDSYFANNIESLKQSEIKRFSALELKSTTSIVAVLVKAVESQQPKLRYVAPWYQGLAIAGLRMFGK